MRTDDDGLRVREWAQQLSEDIAFDVAHGRANRKAESMLDLFRRGLDPRAKRRFRGRVTLTVRCESKGHALGYLYPTAVLPVFVPTVSALDSAKHDRIDGGSTYELRQRRLLAKGRGVNDQRDRWIEQDVDATGRSYHIEGLLVVDVTSESFASSTYHTPPYVDLWCRCGRCRLRKSDLRDAAESGLRILTL